MVIGANIKGSIFLVKITIMSPHSEIVTRLMTYKHGILCNSLEFFISLDLDQAF
jgi:hypothetical protein